MKILFVCLGNICRSPLAEAVFNHKVKEKKLEKMFLSHSCGTANYHIGDAPDPRTVKNALKNGVEIQHLGRQLADEDLHQYDLILAMDQNNYRNIFKLASAEKHKDKIKLMREFDPVCAGDVPDPYYGTEENFQEVFDILNRSMDRLILHLHEKHISFSQAPGA